MKADAATPLLAIPPFPGARLPDFAEPTGATTAAVTTDTVLAALAAARVGGCFWGAQPALPGGGHILDGTAAVAPGALAWDPACDPWHLLAGAAQARLLPDDPRVLLALAAGVTVVPVGHDGTILPDTAIDVPALLARHLLGWTWRNPFSGDAMPVLDAIALCGFWRRLIDANRPITAALGFALWKRPTVAPLLWGGSAVDFRRSAKNLGAGNVVAIWRSRLAPGQAARLERSGARLIEVEDGFIRSAGLGADCVPPQSIIVDGDGVHFDPNQPSGLEILLQDGVFPPPLLAQAAALRAQIVASGVSKYESGGAVTLPRPGGARRHVLVPGQVEDDRAVTSGGALSSNLELLRRARAAAPDAFLIYKPHPDVLAGHRRGAIAAAEMQALADRVETTAPMAGLIAMVDALHVNSSLAGFEALLRGKDVTVHGVPFYAGWGLTDDLGAVPARRTARRSLDELVAAALILYPRYLDPVTGLPCPPDVLVARLAQPTLPPLSGAAAMVVAIRRLQGRTRARLGR